MATQLSNLVKSGYTPIADGAGELLAQRAVFPITAAVPLNDVLDMCILPADHVPVDLFVDIDDLDSAAAGLYDVGFITGVPGDIVSVRTCGAEFLSGANVQAALVARANVATGFRQTARPVDRSIGIKVATAPATPIVGSLAGLLNRGAWRPGIAYALNDYVTLGNGVIVYVTTAGVSGVYAAPDTNLSPSQYEPAWNQGKGLTTVDGTVTWTCQTPVIGLTLLSRAAILNQ